MNIHPFSCELLAPAGNLEKLKVAFTYGADAVYAGGSLGSLRQSADNFSYLDLQAGIDFAKNLQSSSSRTPRNVYVTVNAMPHYQEVDELARYLESLNKLTPLPDALIISDMGVFQLARKYTQIPLHVSTQSSVTRWQSCEFWKEAGASRIVLARELSFDDIRVIQENVDIELEVFIHGSMCVSYSGKCALSTFSNNRDANRGGCIQNCRHAYSINQNATFDNPLFPSAYYLNSKDLLGLSQIPQALIQNIQSLKIEGRMKTPLYLANCVTIYRQAIDYFRHKLSVADSSPKELLQENEVQQNLQLWQNTLELTSHRPFFAGHFDTLHHHDSIRRESSLYMGDHTLCGLVKLVTPVNENTYMLVVEARSNLSTLDSLIVWHPDGHQFSWTISTMFNMANEEISATTPNTLIKIITNIYLPAYSVLSRDVPVHANQADEVNHDS